MSPDQAARRITLSRQTFHALAGAFAADDMVPEVLAGYRQQITAEIVILRQLAAEHPTKAETIGNLVDRYTVLRSHMALQLH